MRVKTSRIELLRLKKRRELVKNGVSILSGKRDALREVAPEANENFNAARRKMENSMSKAEEALIMARATTENKLLSSMAEVSGEDITFAVDISNVWGVKIPVVKLPETRRKAFGRGSAPGVRHPAVDETAYQFEHTIKDLIELAAARKVKASLDDALSKANRRVNALENRVAPQLDSTIDLIRNRIEEMAREETFRLKRFRNKR